MAAGTHHRLEVGDARMVCFAEYGDPSGTPVFYLHGFPSSRLEAGLHDVAAKRSGNLLVAIDRPGYGHSDFAELTITEVAQDVAAIADALGAEHYSVIGVSGGGAYALATASAEPGRVTAVGLLCPLGPPDAPRYGMRPSNRSLLAVAGRRPKAYTALQQLMAPAIRWRSESVVKIFSRTLPERERALVEDHELRAAFAAIIRESAVQNGVGAIGDGLRLTRPWHVDFARIQAPVHIWHGLIDDIVPPGMSGFLQSKLREGTDLTIHPLDGHFSLVLEHIGEVLMWLATSTANSVQGRH